MDMDVASLGYLDLLHGHGCCLASPRLASHLSLVCTSVVIFEADAAGVYDVCTPGWVGLLSGRGYGNRLR